MIRQATEGDREALHELYRAFEDELPPLPDYIGHSTEQELEEVDEILADGLAFLAEDDGGPVGFVLGRLRERGRGVLSDIYVRPDARRRGRARELTQALVSALRERGATWMSLSVEPGNTTAKRVYERWGFEHYLESMTAPVESLEQRLSGEFAPSESFGSVHVQTDDVNAVARAACQWIARQGPTEGTIISQPRNGWIAVYDEHCDREPPLLQRLARELSDRMGAVVLAIGLEQGEVVHYNLYERGRSVDEYLSVPEYYGPLPSGDTVALGANPTVVARLTGADRARFRATARTAASAGELPPAGELLASLAAEMRIEGATHGFAGASDLPGAVRC